MSGIEIPVLIGFFIALPIIIVWGIWKAFSRSVFLGVLVQGLIVASVVFPTFGLMLIAIGFVVSVIYFTIQLLKTV